MRIYFSSSINNFNNIFSLQYLIPVENYEKIYGYKRSRFDLRSDYITFYKKLPIINENEFILQFDIGNSFNFYQNSDVCFYGKNFSTKNAKIIFYDQNIKKIMSARTMLTSEVKDMERYFKDSEVLANQSEAYIEISNIKDIPQLIKNNLIEYEYLNINLYDRILGGIYYAVFKNKVSIISNKRIIIQCVNLLRIQQNSKKLQEENLYIDEIKKGFIKQKNKIYKDINKKLKIKEKDFLEFNSKNEYSVISNNKFNCLGTELEMCNIIINNLLNKLDIKIAMDSIGLEIKNTHLKEKYLPMYRKIYDVVVNGNDKYNIENIESNILKSFFIALIKYNNISEIDDISNKYGLKNSIYPYFFSGIIKKYSNISKNIIDQIEKDMFVKNIINNEKANIEKIIEYNTMKKLYQEICKYQNEEKMYNLRFKNMQKKIKGLEIESISRKIIKLKLEDNYMITFNEAENYRFKKELENLKIDIKKNIRYKSFKIMNAEKKNINDMEAKKILEFIKNNLG